MTATRRERNVMDAPVNVLYDDRTGAVLQAAGRVEINEAVRLVHVGYDGMWNAGLRTPAFEVALHALCQHLGYSPIEIAFAETCSRVTSFAADPSGGNGTAR